jgi:hypothetical protein
MAFNLQEIMNAATGGTSGGMSVAPTSPYLSPVQNLATVTTPTYRAPTQQPVATTVPADRLTQNTTTVPQTTKTDTANTQLGAAVAKSAAIEPVETPPQPTEPSPRETTLARLGEMVGLYKDKGAFTDETMRGEGVYDAKKVINNINKEYAATERHYENLKRELEKNAKGMMTSGMQGRLDDLNRQKNQELADIAIKKSAALGDYQTAFEIAQSKIDAKYEPLDDELKILQATLGIYQDDMTESEKLTAQEAISNRQAERDYQYSVDLAEERAKIEARYDTKDTEKSDLVTLTPEDNRTLLGAGFTSQDIAELPKAVQDFGIDAVLKEYTGVKAEALKKIYNVQPNITLTADYFESLFTEDQLKKAADEAGYRSVWTTWAYEKKQYLNDLMKTVEARRKQGLTDAQILKEMQ